MAVVHGAARIDAHRMRGIGLPFQIAELEAGVVRTLAQPTAEDLGDALDLARPAEVDRRDQARGTGVGAPVVRTPLVHAAQGHAAEVLVWHELEPGTEAF